MSFSRPRVKVCCISSVEEAQQAMYFGASALGLVADMPSGPGVISDADIKAIGATIPPPIGSFLLTSRTKAQSIINHQREVGTNTIQIVDSLVEGNYAEIKKALPGIAIVQVIHVMDEGSIEESLKAAEEVDAILLDSGNPKLSVKELGGTGRTHNWQISRAIREQCPKPIFLAGGLHAGNVQEAIETVEPFGLDLCSGVRSNGALDPHKLEQFFKAVNNI